MASIIGKRIIDTNEDLWCELNALKEILADILSFESGNMPLLKCSDNSPERRNTVSNREQLKHHSGRADECDSDTDSALHNNDDILSGIENHLTITRIHEVITVVRDAFRQEHKELEAEISLLQTTMDTESEIISRGNTPRGDKISESFVGSAYDCDGHLTSPPKGSSSKLMEYGSGKMIESTSVPVHKSVVIMGPGRIRRTENSGSTVYAKKTSGKPSTNNKVVNQSQEEANLAQSLNLKLSELTMNTPDEKSTTDSCILNKTVHSCESPSYSRSNSRNGSKISRMRSRIESARDERFFMDDDIFFN